MLNESVLPGLRVTVEHSECELIIIHGMSVWIEIEEVFLELLHVGNVHSDSYRAGLLPVTNLAEEVAAVLSTTLGGHSIVDFEFPVSD